MNNTAPIGFFDSGMGGLSVLREARKALPYEDYIYFGDSKNAPYGVREAADILALTRAAAHRLLEEGIKALVIACNTATGVSLETLRQELPIPVLGIQPALEAAQALRRDGSILALATPATFKTLRYQALYAAHGDHVIDLPAPGLMEFVEREELSGEGLRDFLAALFAPYLRQKIDVVVLGCTHYPFLKEAIAPFFPKAAMIDDSPRVCRELKEILDGKALLNPGTRQGSVRLLSSGGEEAVKRMERLFYSSEPRS